MGLIPVAKSPAGKAETASVSGFQGAAIMANSRKRPGMEVCQVHNKSPCTKVISTGDAGLELRPRKRIR